MKKSSDKLFLLVSRLTASEKGYINKRLKASNPSSYVMQLFMAICRFKPATDRELRQKIKEDYILRKLAAVKFQLFERILKLLRDYRSNKGEQREVLDIFEDIEILFEKGMHEECKKLIKKAMKICENKGLFGFKLHLLQCKRKMFNHTNVLRVEKIRQFQLDSRRLIEKYEVAD